MHKSHEVSPTNALAMIQKGEGVLIDIREPKEVANKSFDVSNIKLIPLTELKTRFHEIPGDRPVIIACHSGSRSFMATRFLINHGYTQALNLQQGIVRWEKEGLPVKHAPKQQSGSLLRRFFIGKS
ncbi:MAG: rhodanese-like domain-containing protein [Chlorobiaceae bacterium]